MRDQSFGQSHLTVVDRLGVYLSRRPIRNALHPFTRPSVLDLGCGFEARLLRDLAPDLSRGVGVDVKVSDACRELPGLKFVESSIESALTQLAGERFDAVLIVSVLEHLWDPQDILRRCHELLNPNGVLVVNVPNWAGKRALEFSAFRLGMSPPEEMDDHKMYYGKRDLWPLLVRAGFKPSRIHMKHHKLLLNLFATAVRT